MYFSHLCVSAFTSIPLMDASLYAGASSRKTSQTYEVVRVRVPLVLLRINSLCSGDPTTVVRTEFRVSLNGVVLLWFFFLWLLRPKTVRFQKSAKNYRHYIIAASAIFQDDSSPTYRVPELTSMKMREIICCDIHGHPISAYLRKV